MNADIPEIPKVPRTLLPLHFLPLIGRVMIEHTLMDSALNTAISHIARLDRNASISILAKVPNTSTRASILQNLAHSKILDDSQAIKTVVLADLIVKCSEVRNILAHSVPYSYSPSRDEVIYFRDVVQTFPQIKTQPPYKASIKSLTALIEETREVSLWLGMMLPNWIPDGKPLDHTPEPHPSWTDPAQFAWPDKFQHKAARWTRIKDLSAPTNRPA